ncbi:AEC family transporter [Halomicroarcula limicola]|uniref:AEC family transporter n=1 Tax=Haloarcula limicola TaxID=1429915 RepID=A0A8J7Y763_9EURY|nr:AEC family transporter [Halomicroarcula limicola]MBV0925282.1 AEC family transporter [Halomicroarcula limicola]
MDAVGRFAYLLGMLVVGVALQRVGVLNDWRTERLNAVAFYLVLPALIFVSTYDRPLSSLLSPELVVGVAVVMVVTVGAAWAAHRRVTSPERRGIAVVQSYHANLGYLGFPLVAAAYGPDTRATAALLLGLVTLAQVPVTVLVLVSDGADVSPLEQGRALVTNPVLVSLGLGIAVAWFGLGVPGSAVTALSAVGDLALPLALLLVGASLDVDPAGIDPAATAGVVALKLGVMPLVAWVTFSALGVAPAVFTASVLMLGTPTAVSTFVYATELGGDAEFASLNVFVTTVVSLVTLFALMAVV